jgi:hypothetical protein
MEIQVNAVMITVVVSFMTLTKGIRRFWAGALVRSAGPMLD